MKKFLFIASALAIVAGCAKVTTVNTEEPQEIAFKAYNYAATKNGPIEDNFFPTTRAMQVHAVQQLGTNPGYTYTLYFNNVTFTHETGVWTGEKYWPAEGSLIFNAISDGLTSPSFNLADDNTVKSITGTLATNTDNQVDILCANETAPQSCSVKGDVSMKFYHALAWIRINTVEVGNPGPEVKITSIVINGTKQDGTLTVTPTTTPTDKPQIEWSNMGDNVDFKKEFVTDNAPGTAVYVDALVVPNSVGSLTVNYTFEGIAQTTNLELTGSEGKWLDGYKYTYNLSFANNEIKIKPDIAEWGTGTVSDNGDITVGGSSN